MKKLSKIDANVAARNLMDVVKSGRNWDTKTISASLPRGWSVNCDSVDVSDFYPLTISNFTRAFRIYAEQE